MLSTVGTLGEAVDDVCDQLWRLYRDLKGYKLDPTAIRHQIPFSSDV
ncbi:MAG: hypothetical protein Q7T40_02570 [Methylobacter sp.]|nr:hypothetical protein [Methylobacter sp.]